MKHTVVPNRLQEEKVKISNSFTTSIHLVLRNLIEEKSKRDQIKFTSAQLANALFMPRSMITKLTHPEESKRVTNPRIDTLLKIVEFFRSDGFNITINDLLGITTKLMDVQEQKISVQHVTRKIPLYSINFESNTKVGNVDIKISSHSENIIALYANKDIKPFFKKGSIFIVDKDQKPEDGMLVAVKFNHSSETVIKKFHTEGSKKILKSLDSNEKIILLSNQKIKIIGIIIQVNAKT